MENDFTFKFYVASSSDFVRKRERVTVGNYVTVLRAQTTVEMIVLRDFVGGVICLLFPVLGPIQPIFFNFPGNIFLKVLVNLESPLNFAPTAFLLHRKMTIRVISIVHSIAFWLCGAGLSGDGRHRRGSFFHFLLCFAGLRWLFEFKSER